MTGGWTVDVEINDDDVDAEDVAARLIDGLPVRYAGPAPCGPENCWQPRRFVGSYNALVELVDRLDIEQNDGRSDERDDVIASITKN